MTVTTVKMKATWTVRLRELKCVSDHHLKVPQFHVISIAVADTL
jgi:hypothetical protein